MNYYKEIKEELINNGINMRQFYIVSEKWQTLSAKLSWSHYSELILLANVEKNNFYIVIINRFNLFLKLNIYELARKFLLF